MSWHFSQALVEEYSAENSLDGELFAPWKSIPSAPDDSCSGKMKDTFHRSLFGMMFVPLMDARGEELLTWFRAGFPVKIFPLLEADLAWKESVLACGVNSHASLGKYDRVLHLWKIPQCLYQEVWAKYSVTYPTSGIMLYGHFWARAISVRGTKEIASGFLLPTIGANEYRGCSRVRYRGSCKYRGAKMSEGLRTCEADPQYIHPNFAEQAMGWPITWTASTPLETGKYQLWLQLHGLCSEDQ